MNEKRFKKESQLICVLKLYSFTNKNKSNFYVKDYLSEHTKLGIKKNDLVLVYNKELKKRIVYKLISYKPCSVNIKKMGYEDISYCIILRKATKLDIVKNMLGVL